MPQQLHLDLTVGSVAALDAHSFTLFRTETTRSSDTAEALLRRLGIADPAAAAFVRANPGARDALLSRPGRTVTAEATQENQLQKLSAPAGASQRAAQDGTQAPKPARDPAAEPSPLATIQ